MTHEFVVSQNLEGWISTIEGNKTLFGKSGTVQTHWALRQIASGG